MTNKIKFTQITRTICPKTGDHFLDAISDRGEHYTAEMKSGIERWLVFTKQWHKDNSLPLDL